MIESFQQLPAQAKIVLLAIGACLIIGILAFVVALTTGQGTTKTNKPTDDSSSSQTDSSPSASPSPSKTPEINAGSDENLDDDNNIDVTPGISEAEQEVIAQRANDGFKAYCLAPNGESPEARTARLTPWFVSGATELTEGNNPLVSAQECAMMGSNVQAENNDGTVNVKVIFVRATSSATGSDSNNGPSLSGDSSASVTMKKVGDTWFLSSVSD